MRVSLIIILSVSSVVLVIYHSTKSSRKFYKFSSETEKSQLKSEDNTLARRIIKKRARIKPGFLMEQNRRHIIETVRYQWLFLKSQIRLLRKLFQSLDESSEEKGHSILQYMIEHGAEYSKVIEMEINKMTYLDGWNTWRRKEAKNLKKIVKERINNVQNPANCSASRVLVCNLTNPSGFASGAHDILWCFIKAYKEKRRLVLITAQWHYGDWKSLFLPLSDSCSESAEDQMSWPGENNNKARWIMRALPQDLGPTIILLYGNPLAWWYGQFLQYLMRPNSQLSAVLNNLKLRINFTIPIVGVHVRRTDKIGSEAKFHPLEEYMDHVEEYFISLELVSSVPVKRRVFIATDDPGVIKECNKKFPYYECLYNSGSAESATNIETRYSNSSLWNLIVDIFALANTDYIVCTFSSGMCRMAYELKLAMELEDASGKATTLDIPHHYAWVTPPARKAEYNHKPKSSKEISFNKGDILIHRDEYCTVNAALKGKTADGFLKMIRSKKEILEGFVPIYKTRETFQLYQN